MSNSKKPYQGELWEVYKKESEFINRRIGAKESALNNMLDKKVPEKLRTTLESAFEKAFLLVFEKGTEIIEKTYSKEDLQRDFRAAYRADRTYNTQETRDAFSKNASIKGNINVALSGISGISMGLLGVGIPDIPVFIGLIMKCLYETALSYGFDYESEKEKYFMLLIIEGAVSYGEHMIQTNKQIQDFLNCPKLPENYDFREQVAKTSKVLSSELLYMKFLQGIPIIGVVGGTYDIIQMKNIKEYADIKYHKRFLSKYKKP